MPRQLTLDLPHIESTDERDFLPSSSNAQALAQLARWPRWPSPVTVLFGPEGCGKTHLARIWAARANAVWLDSNGLWLMPPRDLFPSPATCLVIDEADLAWDQQTLFHLFNLVTERRGSLLMTATLPPSRWPVDLPDLRSRLMLAAPIAIGPPDDTLLAALYVKQLADRGLRPDPGVVEWLIAHGPRSFGSVRRIVGELDRASLRARRPVTIALARGVLVDLSALEGLEPDEEREE
ncbi:MAG TPA: DNA replication protein [Geminicoccus sp.]|jgi:chromosomal replication initiation ATPase DnaA|uniref:HdaA/DnaA family protein n=1 Tax=Geminicoccus sp. TaxID=2024832 RepID=UPI002E382051|nr:DNA replication protein [Geminicoccus sp.]HEX2525071.1 DNA replication protein [Geminicoccus sp.]